MARDNLPDLSLFIKQHLQSCEYLRETLTKATALLQVSLENDILQHPKATVNFYLWVIHDLVDGARKHNEEALNGLRVKEQEVAVDD